MRTLREAWPQSARQKSIVTRQQQAALKKTTLYLQTATGTSVAASYSPRQGFIQSQPPDTKSEEK